MTSGIRSPNSPERVDRVLARVAEDQYGLVSRAQVIEAGATNGLIQRRLDAGRWVHLFPGVYRMAGTPASWRQQVLAACLAAGDDAIASHRAAARLWGTAGLGQRVVELSVPHARRVTLPGVRIHRTRDLPRIDLTVRDGIPVTTIERTLIDLAAVAHIDAVEEALDDIVRRRLTTVRRVARRVETLERKGRCGIGAIRLLLEARASGGPVSESTFEIRLLRAIGSAGLPLPVLQYEVRHQGRFVARVDFAYRDAKLAIEADGYGAHAGRARFDRDRARLNALTLLGWRVIHVTWTQLRDEPDTVIAQIAGALTMPSPR
jgi:hypothetical protein